MACGKKYTIQSAGKQNLIFTYEIWEKDYAGTTVTQLKSDKVPILHNLIAESDAPFAAILPSVISATALINIFDTNLPDFMSTDDHKYLVKLTANYVPGPSTAYVIWQNYRFSQGMFTYNCTMRILVNGILIVNTNTVDKGFLVVSDGDIVEIQLSYDAVSAPPGDGVWKMIVDKDGVEQYNVNEPSPSPGVNQSYTFMAMGGSVYRAVTESTNPTHPGSGLPDTYTKELWQGFLINDQVDVPFIAGLIPLKFDAVDGLALLKNSLYAPANRDINVLESLLQVVKNCLDKIQFPSYNINVCISVFAVGMNDRGAGTQYEPLSQSYYAPRNWLNSDGTLS